MITPETLETYPASLRNDKTKIGEQATLVHFTEKGEIFMSLVNGILTLKQDGTWHWSER